MKKVLKVVSDVCVTVGCCVGVGFLSGKEMQVFVGNALGVLLFCLCFGASLFVVRERCRICNYGSVGQLGALFGKMKGAFSVVTALCSFVCIVTVLAGAEQCLSSLYDIGLPFYSFAVALCGALLLRLGMKTLKVVNALSVAMAVALVMLLYVRPQTQNHCHCAVSPVKTVAYALFSVTMSLGVLTKLSCECTRRQNVLCSVASAVVLSALMLALLPLCDMNRPLPALNGIEGALVPYAVITLALCGATGIASNAFSVAELLRQVIPDDTVCCVLMFGSALAFSMFGFDFALKFGYMLVACVGGILIITIVLSKKSHVRRNPI